MELNDGVWTRAIPQEPGYYLFKCNATSKSVEVCYVGYYVDYDDYRPLRRIGREETDALTWRQRTGCWFGPKVNTEVD